MCMYTHRVDFVGGIESMRVDLRILHCVLWSKEWQMLFNVDKTGRLCA